MQLYKDVLSTAWRQTIHRPFLWMFGLFAAFIFGTAGEIDRYLQFMNAIVTDDEIVNPVFWLQQRWATMLKQVVHLLVAGDVSTWVFMGVVVLALLCTLIMISISAGALLSYAIDPKKTFPEAFHAGRRHWVALFFLFVSGYVIISVSTLFLGAVIFSWNLPQDQSQHLFILIGSIIFIPTVIILSFIIRFTATHIVVHNSHLLAAVGAAIQLWRRHWLVTFEMAVINFVIVSLVNLALAIGVVVLLLPQYSANLALASSTLIDRLFSIVMVSTLIYVVLSIFAGAILSAWQWIAWAVFFRRLETEQPRSVLVSVVHRSFSSRARIQHS